MSAEDSAALARAASAAEDALQLECEALSVLRDGWTGESASAAADFIDVHRRAGEELVAALRHAATVLGSQDGAAAPQPAAVAPATPMNWPAVTLPTIPDFGGAIGNLLASAIDAFGGSDAAVADAADPTAAEDPVAGAKPSASPVPAPAAVSDPVPPPVPDPVAPPVSPPPQSAPPLLAAELPPPQADPIAAPDPAAERTPCEIAADELPQVGE